jgi:hypothetical protein
MAIPGGWQVCLESTREAFRNGVLGHAWEGYRFPRPWGFSMADIVLPVDLRHGILDLDAPVGMGRALSRVAVRVSSKAKGTC